MQRLLTRLSVRRWSLRARLLAAVVGLVAAALATTGTVGVTLLHSYLMHQVDQQLAIGAARVLDRPAPVPVPVPPPTGVTAQLPTPYWFTEIGTGGAVLHQRGGPGAPGRAGPGLSGPAPPGGIAQQGQAVAGPSVHRG